jgi:hypothetical protein
VRPHLRHIPRLTRRRMAMRREHRGLLSPAQMEVLASIAVMAIEVRSKLQRPADAVLGHLLDLAGITAVRGGAANRVGRVNADRQIDVSALGIERIIAG